MLLLQISLSLLHLLVHVSLVLHLLLQPFLLLLQLIHQLQLLLLELFVVGVDGDQPLGQVLQVVAVEVDLAEALLQVFEELRQLASVTHQRGDHVHQELVHFVSRLEADGRVVSEGGVLACFQIVIVLSLESLLLVSVCSSRVFLLTLHRTRC
jgi:hypothetical protein